MELENNFRNSDVALVTYLYSGAIKLYPTLYIPGYPIESYIYYFIYLKPCIIPILSGSVLSHLLPPIARYNTGTFIYYGNVYNSCYVYAITSYYGKVVSIFYFVTRRTHVHYFTTFTSLAVRLCYSV